MRRFAIVCGVVFLVLSAGRVTGAEAPAQPGKDQLKINPFPPIVKADEEAPAREPIISYVGDRLRDLADVVTFKFGWGTARSLGFQVRLCYPIQVGAGVFEGWVFAVDRGCVGTMKEAEIEGGISIFYPAYIARKVIWQTEDAKRRNVFFGDVGDKKALLPEDLKMYDDENQNPLTSTVQLQLPCLPKIELSINWAELFDFPLSIFNLDKFRVPPPFQKQAGPDGEEGERIPAPSIFWHGQEKYENYE